MTPPRIISLQVGRPKSVAKSDSGTMRTSLLKTPVEGAVWLGPEDLEGNYQADRKHHGGPDKAICCFPSEHYPALSDFLGQPLAYGAFGENFTLAGLLETEVCIGDRFRAGDAVVEVSQPRTPCATLIKRYGPKELPAWILDHGTTGWYFRTIEEGLIEPGETLHLLSRPHPGSTIAEMNRIMFTDRDDRESVRAAAGLEELSAWWRQAFEKRVKDFPAAE